MPDEMTMKSHTLTGSEPRAVYFTERVRRDDGLLTLYARLQRQRQWL